MTETVIAKLSAWLGFKVDDKGLLKFKLGITGATTALLKFTNDTVKAIVQLDNFTKRTGINEDFTYEFINLAKVANISTDTILNSLETITKARQDFLIGEGNVQPWAWLGVDITKDPEQVFKDILDNIKDINDPALASKLLNDAGLDSQLINLVNNIDINGINKNLFLNKDNRDNIKLLSNEINKLRLNLTLLKDKFISLATPIKLGIELINRLILAFTNIIESTIGLDKFAKILTNTLLVLFTVIFPKLSIITLMALAIDDFITYLKGGESIIGDFIKQLKLIWQEGNSIIKVLLLIGGYIGTVFAVGQITTFINTLDKALMVLNAAFAKTPLGMAILATGLGISGINKFYDWLGKKQEKKDNKKQLEDYNKYLDSRKQLETLGVKLNDPIKIGLSGGTMNNTKNNNITITNNMNITGNNANEIANTIKDAQDKMIMDNVALQLN